MAKRFTWAVWVAIILMLPTTANGAMRQGYRRIPKMDRAVESAANAGTGMKRVIIRVKPGMQRNWATSLRQRGYQVRRVHTLVNSLTVDVPARLLESFTKLGFVEQVSADAKVMAAQAPPDPTLLYGGMMATLGLPQLPAGAHADRRRRDRLGDPAECGSAAVTDHEVHGLHAGADPLEVEPYDDYGHGTHVAGLIGASGALSSGAYPGVAPNVQLHRAEGARRERRGHDQRRR